MRSHPREDGVASAERNPINLSSRLSNAPVDMIRCSSMSMERDVEFLYEMGALRFLQRTWTQLLRERDMANLAEHSFRVAWTAMLIGKHEGANIGKVTKMALVHDLGESRTGDAHYVSRFYVERDEERAIEDMFAQTGMGDEMKELWLEYEACETIEAKCVKDADWLDVDLELRELSAKGDRIGEKDLWHRDQLREKLHTPTGKKLWDAIYANDPHAWHRNATNRYNSGDWQKETQTPARRS